MFSYYDNKLKETDLEFIELFDNFLNNDVNNTINIDNKTKAMVILSTLIGSQSTNLFKQILSTSINEDITPTEVKEIIYQAVAYLGLGRVYPFFSITNEVLESMNIKLPLTNQSTTTNKTRLEKGVQAQVDIFGEDMKDFYKSGSKETRHINKWLASNCFGDYYTRNGLDYKQREMITFCFILAQGGCESQLTSHAIANMQVGNDKEFLINIISQALPFIGYPRSLNALTCLNNAIEIMEEK